MFYVRTVKTTSSAIAVQVVEYKNYKRVVVKHIGSAHNNDELVSLKKTAYKWIDRTAKQQNLFSFEKEAHSTLVPIDKLKNLGFRYTFAYEIITKIFRLLQFTELNNPLFLDMVLIRIVRPASKLESLKLLSEYFGINHKRTAWYRRIAHIVSMKGVVEKKAVTVAKRNFAFDFSIVFYDVTTLYFETFGEDKDAEHAKGLRKAGFSKDNKANQPQIVIGLIVTREGFPIAYDIFEGNTFEGKTFIPMITKFKKSYDVKTLTVVADAAMISLANVQSLIANDLSYIVGARIGNLKLGQIKQISKDLNSVDGSATRIETERGLLVCDFSLKRYKKDKREMDKQIRKAEYLINASAKIKRNKFLKIEGETTCVLNTDLIEKTKLLLGVRGYYTNLIDQTNDIIITHYHSLWHVEQAFRIAKSDLEMRPIYHFKKHTIEAHVLMCFMALAVCKYLELKTGRSTKAIVKLLTQVTDARLLNTITNEEFTIRSELLPEMLEVLRKLFIPH